MEKNDDLPYISRQLNKDEMIPYDLLLLADEAVEVINKYIFVSEIYVYEVNRKMIALYVLQIIDRDTIEIKNIAVQTEYQGKGIGKSLLKDAGNRAKGRGFKTIIIGTGDGSTSQLNLYQKEGFEIFDSRKNFFLDNYPDPVFENGVQLKHMILLKKELS